MNHWRRYITHGVIIVIALGVMVVSGFAPHARYILGAAAIVVGIVVAGIVFARLVIPKGE